MAMLLDRLNKRHTIEVDLIAIDETTSQLHGADTVNFDGAFADWNRRMPLVEKAIANRQRTAMAPAPVGILREQTNEVLKQGVTALKPPATTPGSL